MRIAVLGLALLGVVACTSDRPPNAPSSTTTTAAPFPPSRGMDMADHVRATLREQRVAGHADLDSVVIIESDGIITLAGEVGDERARAAIVDAVRNMEGIRDVRDVMRIRAKTPGR